MDFDLDVFLQQCKQAFIAYISNGWYCIISAVVILIFAIFSMTDRQSSAGSWTFIVIAVVLFMMGLGNLTGMGFGMSF